MKVLNYIFKDQPWKIYQDSEMFNFSIDSLILARKTTLLTNDVNVLEIGTNNGVVSLILALAKPNLKITALEIQETACELAKENFILNKVSDNISLENVDFNQWSINNTTKKFDLIICNPPFFKINNNKMNKNVSFQIARHELKLTLEDIISKSSKLLKNKGRLSLIYPPSRLKEIFIFANKYNFSISKLQFIFPKFSKPSQSVLIELNLNGKHNLIVQKPFVIQNHNNEYSEQAKAIYRWNNEGDN